VETTAWPGVFRLGRELFTRNAVPGRRVYGEELRSDAGIEYRRWDPWRSKLAAYLLQPGAELDLAGVRRLLYLGAAHGTTVSHLADILPEAQIFAVDKSPVSFPSLLVLARERPNLLPLLADAQLPERYQADVGPVEFLYQDVAQRDQARIFAENAAALLAPGGRGLLLLKIRSVTQRGPPGPIVAEAGRVLRRAGLAVRISKELAPYSREHVALAVQS
jgi:fibrillarin-like pre-rRNA processing protein